ncbi:ABC transporter ATP-binding protein [Corynebacterium sp. H128]|uniref:ABC transporter ATP-binding protein n=1 Tax=Corynebacterium sp. H128 TaxID=3133427 RepID=UPI0030AB23AD
MIHINNLNVSFKEPVLDGLNVDLAPELIHGLIGPNGAGKTTLMRVLAGQQRYSGTVSEFGEEPWDNESTMSQTIYAGVDMPLMPRWSGKKIFGLAAQRWQSFDEARAHELAARFEVPVDKPNVKLSLGQRSALLLCFGLAARCRLTLLDEPYLGIDAERRELLYRTVLEEQELEVRTIVLSTHHINESARVLDAVHLLYDGKITISATAPELQSRVVALLGPNVRADQVSTGVLSREKSAGYSRLIVDMSALGSVPEGLRAEPVDLETAVLALSARTEAN